MLRFAPQTPDAAFGLQVRRSDDGKRGLSIRYEKNKLTISELEEGNITIPLLLNSEMSELALHIYLDKAIMEMFVNGGSKYACAYMHRDPSDVGIQKPFEKSLSGTQTSQTPMHDADGCQIEHGI